MVVVVTVVISIIAVLLVLSTGVSTPGSDEMVKGWLGVSFVSVQMYRHRVSVKTYPVRKPGPYFKDVPTVCCTSSEMIDVQETDVSDIVIGWEFENSSHLSNEPASFSGRRQTVQFMVVFVRSVEVLSFRGGDYACAASVVRLHIAVVSQEQPTSFVLVQCWSWYMLHHFDFTMLGSSQYSLWHNGRASHKYNVSAVGAEKIYKVTVLVLQLHHLQAENVSTPALNENSVNNVRKLSNSLKTIHGNLHVVKRQKENGMPGLGSMADAILSSDTFHCNTRQCHAHQLTLYSYLKACCLLILMVLRSSLCRDEESQKMKQNSRRVVTLKFHWKLSFEGDRLAKGQFCPAGEVRCKHDTFVMHSSIQFALPSPWLLKSNTNTVKPRWGGSKTGLTDDISNCSPVASSFFIMTSWRHMGPQVIEARPQTRFLPDATMNPSTDMAAVGYRLASLSVLPASFPVSRTRLAEAGFYSRGQGDQLICFSCGAQHSGWRKEDNPIDIHRRLSPQCEHVLETNRSIATYQGESRQGQASSSQEQTPTSPGQQRAAGRQQQPAERGRESRQPSGQQHSSSPSQTAQRSTPSTVVASETAQPPPTSTTASHTNNPVLSNDANTNLPRMYPAHRLDLNLAVYPNMTLLQNRQRSFPHWDDSRAPPLNEILLSGFFYAGYADCVRCFYCGVGLKNWVVEDSVWKEHVRWRPACGYLRAIKGDAFIQDMQRGLGIQPQPAQPPAGPNQPPAHINAVATATTSTTSQAPGTASTSQSALATTTTLGSTTATTAITTTTTSPSSIPSTTRRAQSPARTGVGSSVQASGNPPRTGQGAAQGATTGGMNIAPTDASDRQTLASLQAEHRQLTRRLQCRICRQVQVDTIFMPCGHLVTCASCAATVQNCPMCGQVIRATAFAYFG